MNYLGLIARGGVVMWAILLCAVIAAAVVVERLVVLGKAQRGVGQFMLKVKTLFGQGDVNGVLAFCSQKDDPVAHIIRTGMEHHGESEERIRFAMNDAQQSQVYRLDRRLPLLMSLVGIAPMLGLLGTVLSFIREMHNFEIRGGAVAAPALAGAAWESLVLTAMGLSIGILALGWYFYLRSRVDKCGHEFSRHGQVLIEMLVTGNRPQAVPSPPPLRSRQGSPATRTFAYEEDQFFRRKS